MLTFSEPFHRTTFKLPSFSDDVQLGDELMSSIKIFDSTLVKFALVERLSLREQIDRASFSIS